MFEWSDFFVDYGFVMDSIFLGKFCKMDELVFVINDGVFDGMACLFFGVVILLSFFVFIVLDGLFCNIYVYGVYIFIFVFFFLLSVE